MAAQIEDITKAAGAIGGAGSVISGDKSIKVEHQLDKSVNTTIYILIGGIIVAIIIYKLL
jgi:hypothetical protein